MTSIIVTGSTGFIGKHLVSTLSQEKRDLHLLSRKGKDGSMSIDLNCVHEVDAVFAACNADTVVHLASDVRSIQSEKDIACEANMAINVMSAIQNSCRFIYLSTADEYSSSPNPISENGELHPINPYARAKFEARKALETKAKEMNLELVVLRPFLVYGMGQPPHMFIPQLLKSIIDDKVFHYSARRKIRDYVHVSDVVQAIRLLVDCETDIGGVYNIGTGIGTSLSEVIKIVENKIGQTLNVERDQSLGVSNPDRLVSDSERIKKEIGWQPKIELSCGLSDLIETTCA